MLDHGSNKPVRRFHKLKQLTDVGFARQINYESSLSQINYWLKKKSRQPFVLFVILPWLMVATYTICFKTPVYESTTSILFTDTSKNSEHNPSIMQSILHKGKHELHEVNNAALLLVKKYLYSSDLLQALENSLQLKNYYRSSEIDRLSRFTGSMNQDAFRDYFLSKIKVAADPYSGELIIATKAYSPEKAKQIAALASKQAIDYFNTVSQSSFKEQAQQAKQLLHTARSRLIEAQLALKQTKANTDTGYLKLQLEVKLAQAEYEAAQQAHIIWQITTVQHAPIVTSAPSLAETASSPNIRYDLCFFFVIFTVFYLLANMVRAVIREHVD